MIDKLFYIIYNKYYKHGEYKNDNPPLTVFGLFFIATLCLVYLAYLVPKVTVDPTAYEQHRLRAPHNVIFILGLTITYFSFYYQQRYKRIYEKYKEDTRLDSISVRVTAFVIIYLAILSPFIFIILWIRIHQGMWITIGPW